MESKRMEWLDALRGFAVCLMVLHHIGYDACAFGGVPWRYFDNAFFDCLHYLSSTLFITLCGVSARLSRSNLRRGARTMALALAITAVTYLMDMTIVFGVLHLLASCMLLYGLSGKLWERLPRRAAAAIALVSLALTYPLANGVPTQIPHLWILGFTTPDFSSSDYFPLLPWIFVFLLGTVLGEAVKAGRLPRRICDFRAPRLAAVGRHALAIYVIHQPLLAGLTLAAAWIFKC